jgi:hypothetical protein
MRKAIALLVFLTPLVGVAPPVAEAKKPSTRMRVHLLEKRLARVVSILNDQEMAIAEAYNYAAAVEACILPVPVDGAPFMLEGVADPVEVLTVSQRETPDAWVALVDESCVVQATPAARSFGGRSYRLRVAP